MRQRSLRWLGVALLALLLGGAPAILGQPSNTPVYQVADPGGPGGSGG